MTLRMQILLIAAIALASLSLKAQNVGIGTSNPQKKLTVNGSIMLDPNNQNTGTLDSAALVFGSSGGTGISSRKIGGGSNGLSFWTNGAANVNISSDGNMGIGGGASGSYRMRVYNGNSYFEGSLLSEGSVTALTNAAIGGQLDPVYKLRVYDGNSRFGGDLHATGNVAFGGDVDPVYRLRVIGGNSRFGGDLYATGNAAFGGDVDNNYRLRVWGGNSRFGGDVQVTGDLNTTGLSASNATVSSLTVSNTMTIDGKGSVKSNGTSPLRIGFDQKGIDVFLGGNATTSVTANITNFSGDNDDVRVFVSQVQSDIGTSLFWSNISVVIMGVDSGTNTCTLWLRNLNNVAGLLKGTVYLTTIAKN